MVYFAIPADSSLHRETGRFLSSVGLPTSRWFTPLDDLAEREGITFTPGLADYFDEDDGADALHGRERWGVLVALLHWTLLIDPESGKVYSLPEGEDEITYVHADVSSLVHALIVLEEGARECRSASDGPDYALHAEIVERMRSHITEIDQTPFASDDSCWSRLFEEIAMGMWG